MSSVKSVISSHTLLLVSGKGSMSTPGSSSGSPVNTPRGSVMPRPGGRRGLVERSPLIRHPSTVSSVTTGSVLITRETESEDGFNNNVISTENHQFIKDVSLCGNSVSGNILTVNLKDC